MNNKTLYSEKRIQKKVYILANQIHKAKIDDPVILIVLDGAMFFATDLLKALSYWDIYPEIETVQIKSYKKNRIQGRIRLLKKWKNSLKNRNVIIVEDIIDSGKTVDFLIKKLKKKSVKKVFTASLLKRQGCDVFIDFLGFIVKKNVWVVGYGLDNNNKQRSLQEIIEL